MSIVQTGDLHVYVADLVQQQIYIAFAAKTGASGPAMAYDRSFIKIDLKVNDFFLPSLHLSLHQTNGFFLWCASHYTQLLDQQ
jgi:hypothetical protein